MLQQNSSPGMFMQFFFPFYGFPKILLRGQFWSVKDFDLPLSTSLRLLLCQQLGNIIIGQEASKMKKQKTKKNKKIKTNLTVVVLFASVYCHIDILILEAFNFFHKQRSRCLINVTPRQGAGLARNLKLSDLRSETCL